MRKKKAMNEKSKVLERLYSVIESRKRDNPENSYTAKLLAQGISEIARKLGEEAVETIIASLAEEEDRIVEESADLIYHLLVLWALKDISPEMVWAELIRREDTSGIEEKSFRKVN